MVVDIGWYSRHASENSPVWGDKKSTSMEFAAGNHIIPPLNLSFELNLEML